MQTQNITLDFCRNDYTTITIKQYDANSRHVLITCTDNGTVYKLDSSTYTCNVKMMTPDNRAIWDNKCVKINEDGNVLITFSDNMVSKDGVGILEIQFVENATSRLLSTMILTVIIVGSVFSNDIIIASDEFNVLKDIIDKAMRDYAYVIEKAKTSADVAKLCEENSVSLVQEATAQANRAKECADTIDTSVIETKISVKGDNLYYDNDTNLLHLMSDGQIIGNGTRIINSDNATYATTSGTANAVAWNNISEKPSTYAPSSHNHDDVYYAKTDIDDMLSNYCKAAFSYDNDTETLTITNQS